jgi:hypothetical protein
MTKDNGKPPAGGKRPGAGRPRGKRNASTIAREENARRVVDDILSKLDMDKTSLSPLETLLLIMSLALRAHDLSAAQAAAIAAAPYVHPRLGTAFSAPPLPADLLPDVDEPPDEGEPPGGRID